MIVTIARGIVFIIIIVMQQLCLRPLGLKKKGEIVHFDMILT